LVRGPGSFRIAREKGPSIAVAFRTIFCPGLDAAASAAARSSSTTAGKEVVASVFEKITFTPVKSTDGPRCLLEGLGNLGPLLGLDDDAKRASPGGPAGW
jgi:hypothetical protein